MDDHLHPLKQLPLACALLAVSLGLSGCGLSPKASEHTGEWKKVNAFTEDIQVIPLQTSYVYNALRIDTTLHQLLERWARDTGLDVELRCVNDYSLPGKLLQLKAPTLKLALQDINQTYSRQGVKVSLDNAGRTLALDCETPSSAPSQRRAAPSASGNQDTPPELPRGSKPSTVSPATPQKHQATGDNPTAAQTPLPVTLPASIPAQRPSTPELIKPQTPQQPAGPSGLPKVLSDLALPPEFLAQATPTTQASPPRVGLVGATAAGMEETTATPQGEAPNSAQASDTQTNKTQQRTPAARTQPVSPPPSCAVLSASQRSIWGKGGAQANRVQAVRCQTEDTLAWRQN